MPKVWNKRDPNCPKDAVYVGRPSKWGNPWNICPAYPRGEVIVLFRIYATVRLSEDPHWLDELKGRDLVCWCAPLACHGDVLLELANQEVQSVTR